MNKQTNIQTDKHMDKSDYRKHRPRGPMLWKLISCSSWHLPFFVLYIKKSYIRMQVAAKICKLEGQFPFLFSFLLAWIFNIYFTSHNVYSLALLLADPPSANIYNIYISSCYSIIYYTAIKFQHLLYIRKILQWIPFVISPSHRKPSPLEINIFLVIIV